MRVIVTCATVPATRPGDRTAGPWRSSMKIGSVILVVWLVIGALAAYQRNYFSSETANCAQIGTVLLTIGVVPPG